MLYNIFIAYFIHHSLYFLTPYAYIAFPHFLLPTGNYYFVLYICESISFLLYSLVVFFFWIPHTSDIRLPRWLSGKESVASSVGKRVIKNLLPIQETQEMWVWSLGQEDTLEKKMATHSSILAWKVPWTEEPDGLQSMGSQSQTWMNNWTHMHT